MIPVQIGETLRYVIGNPRQRFASFSLAYLVVISNVGSGKFDPRCGRTSAECTSDRGPAMSVTSAVTQIIRLADTKWLG